MAARIVATAMMLVLFAVAPEAPARADEFIRIPETINTGSKPDTFGHTFCWGSSIWFDPDREAAGEYAMANLDSQSVPYYDTYIASCSGATDVRFEAASLPDPNTYAVYHCLPPLNVAGECEAATVTFNTTTTNPLSASINRQIACHEVGHSLGLTHNQADCMKNGVTLADGGSQTYNAHHLGHMQGSHDSPIGHLDVVLNVPGVGVRVQGWTLDPDVGVSPKADVHIYIDTYYGYNLGAASGNRVDIGAEYPWWGPNHGFDWQTGVGPGLHQVCAYGINTSYGGANTLLGCTWVTVT